RACSAAFDLSGTWALPGLAALAGSASCCLCSATTRGAALGTGLVAAARTGFTGLALAFAALFAARARWATLLRKALASTRALARCGLAAVLAFALWAGFPFGLCFTFAVALAMYRVPGGSEKAFNYTLVPAVSMGMRAR